MAEKPKKGWMIYWAVWVFGFFLIPELIAVLNKEPGDTFSETIWFLRDLGSFFWFVIAGLLAWLAYHFLFEKRGR